MTFKIVVNVNSILARHGISLISFNELFFITASGPSIVTTVVPVGPHPTHMICPSCHAEIDTATQTKPGLIAYISGAIICLVG